MVKKVLLTLDMQSLDLNIPFKSVYNAVSLAMKSMRFAKAVIAVQTLESKGIDAKIIVLDSSTEDILHKAKIKTISAKEVTENLYDLKNGEITYEFLQNFVKTLGAIDPVSSYKGIPLPDLDAKNLWRSFVLPSIVAMDSYTRIIQKERPHEAIILNNAHAFQKIFKAAAESSGIVVEDRTSRLAALPWLAKRIAMENLGKIMTPSYLRKLRNGGRIELKKSGKRKIIIAHDTIGASKVLPWAKKLVKKYDVVYVGSGKNSEDFERTGMKYRRLQDYSNSGIIQELKHARNEFEHTYHGVIGNPKLMAALSHNGTDMREIFDEMMLYLYYIAYPILASYVELFNEMIEREQPDLIITVDELSRFGRALVRVADNKGIKTMIVQHGALLDHPLFTKIVATKFAVYGQQTKEILVKRGARPQQVEIVGQAENIPAENHEKIKSRIFTELNLNKHKKLVTFASQALAESVNYPSFEIFYKSAKEFPEVQFVVKLHPDESEKLHREFIRKFELDNVAVVKNTPIKELLIASDLVVNIYSTVGMEALALGKQLVSINVNLPKSYFPSGKGAYIASSAKGIKGVIGNIMRGKGISKETIKKESKYYISETGEKACGNVAKTVDKLIK